MTKTTPLESSRFCILLALAKEPLHGYALEVQIQRDAGGLTYISTQTIYANLARLETLGFVEAVTQRGSRRRMYQVTPAGRRLLRAEATRLADATVLARQRLARH